MPPSDPGQRAAVLVAFATIGDRPNQTREGNVRSVPPPATELIMPATKAAPKMAIQWKEVIEASLLSTNCLRGEWATSKPNNLDSRFRGNDAITGPQLIRSD